ncbi:MAG TPA: hypothetical protein VF593_01805 [Chthoniobacteraceae bacterium]
MKTAPIDDVLRSLRAVRRRLVTQSFLILSAQVALLLGAGLVVFAAVNRWLLGRMPLDGFVAAIAAVGAVFLVIVIAFLRRGTLPETAAVIDRLGETRDRFVTALALGENQAAPEPHRLALEECLAFIRGRDFSRLIRLRMPRELPYLLVPALALALLQWEARATFGTRMAAQTQAREEVEPTARELEKLAEQLEKKRTELNPEELQRMVEELKRSAQQIRAEAGNPEDAQKAALRELSQLEQMVQQLQKPPELPSAAELRELAKALAQSDETKSASAAMEAGDPAKAAEQLEKALQELAAKKDERTAEQIDQALKDALEKMAQQQQLSEALQKLAQQLQKQAGQDGKAGQMSKELAEMLKNLKPQAGQQNQAGKPQSAESMKNLLAALQNLKFGEGQPGEGGKSQPKPGSGGMVVMQSPGPSDSPGEGGDPNLPSGAPGSERDTGTTDDPLAKNAGEAGRDADSQALSGRLGEGETMQQFLPSAGDSTKSRQRYRELYNAMAPAAEEAVVQEEIPLGSRFFIKRYFESIRPAE